MSGFAYLIALVVPQFAPYLRAAGQNWLSPVASSAPVLLWLLLGLTEPGYLAGAVLGFVAVRRSEDLWKAALLPLLGIVVAMATRPLHERPADWLPALGVHAGFMLLHSLIGASAAFYGKRQQPRWALAPASLIAGAAAAYWADRLARSALPAKLQAFF